MKRIPFIFFGLGLVLLFSAGGQADDTEVLVQSGCTANVLVIFDNSTSMNGKVPYDDSLDYSAYARPPLTCGATKCADGFQKDKWYYTNPGKVTPPSPDPWCCCVSTWGGPSSSEGGTSTGSGSCKIYKYVDWNPKTMRQWVDADKNGQDDINIIYTATGYYQNTKGMLFRGNYLNYLYYYTETRFQAAKAAVENLLDTYGTQINFGLMVFRKDTDHTCPYRNPQDGYYYYHSDGGEMIEPIGPNKAQKFKDWFDDKRTQPGGISPRTNLGYLKASCNRADQRDPAGKTPYEAIAANSAILRGEIMFTPLAESLTHAGMYFEAGWKGYGYYASTKDWSNPELGCTYSKWNYDDIRNICKSLPFEVPNINGPTTVKGDSPITTNQQKNYVILMTDGNPANDGASKILAKYLTYAQLQEPFPSYFKGGSLWYMDDRMDTAMEESGSSSGWLPEQRYLISVADTLYKRDLAPKLDDLPGLPGGGKNLTTYIIGFGLGNDFLKAAASKGGTDFAQVGNADALKKAFLDIAGEIVKTSIVVPTASIPSDGMVSGNYMYVPFAYPAASGIWHGDLQKHAVDRSQLNEGQDILASSDPKWSVEANLKRRLQGGTDNRNIYTYLAPGQPLNGKPNLFDLTNSEETGGNINKSAKRLNITGTDLKASDIIRFIRGYESDGKTPREKILGDILHSIPVAVQYSTETVIYFGANDGMLHAVDEVKGNEKWAFIPPILLPRLQELYSGANHPYFVDGSPKVAELNSKGLIASSNDEVVRRILVFGLRKGGSAYYALDISNPNLPEFLWEITDDPKKDFAELGEAWSDPVFGNIKVGGVTTAVALFGAGYSKDNSKGRGVYAVKVVPDGDEKVGKKVWSKTVSDSAAMKSIPSTVLPFDIEEDGIIDRIYVGDLAGQMWVFNLSPKDEKDWTVRLLFQPGVSGLKIFYPPELAKEKDASYLYFGTGDRENPKGTSVVNRLYCVKDKDLAASKFATIGETTLVNLTSNDLQESTDEKRKGEIRSQLKEKDGWLIQLENPGEKCLAPVTVFLKVAYYTTFAPTTEACKAGGEARVYAVHYTDGQSVFNWDKKNDNMPSGPKAGKGKSDRVIKLGEGGIPSEIIITIISPQKDPNGKIPPGNAGGLVVPLVASGGGVMVPGEAPVVNTLTPYSWRAGSQ